MIWKNDLSVVDRFLDRAQTRMRAEILGVGVILAGTLAETA